MPLDMDRIKQKQKETASRGGGNFFKCVESRNTIRVFAFEHKVTKEDVALKLFPKDKLGKTVTEIDRPVTRFFPKNRAKGKPRLSSGPDDPRMVEFEKGIRSKSKKDQDAARENGPRTSYFINVVDTSKETPKVVEFAAPKTVYDKILSELLDPEGDGEEMLGCKGRDFVITFDKSKKGADMYDTKLRDAKKCEELPESVEEGVQDFYDPETLAKLAAPADSEDASDDDEDEDDDTDDEDLDEDDEDEDDDDDEDSDDEDEDDEDEDEDEDDDEGEDEDEDKDEAPRRKSDKDKKDKKKKK